MAVAYYVWAKCDSIQLRRVYPQFEHTLAKKPQADRNVGFLLTFKNQADADGAAGWLKKIDAKFEGPSDVIPGGFKNMYTAAVSTLLDKLTNPNK